jgi:DNA-binding NtrC family response regulator
MERIALYHRGDPITYHTLNKTSFSIGSDQGNDLVLAASGVSERHLVVYCDSDGRWRARSTSQASDVPETALDSGTRVVLGPYSVEVVKFDSGEVKSPLEQEVIQSDEQGLVGSSLSMNFLRNEIVRVGPLKAPVLISGETGTGKELVARGLHRRSRGSRGSFVPINCGSMTDSLIEDVLFGHETGAFTGAGSARKGVFEQAGGGTLFLDEIGELPLNQQAALLRVLDDRQIRRVGGDQLIDVDFRLIAATNRDLLKRVETGMFRLDLYHRIAALLIETDSLRNRLDDIELLARHFLQQMAGEVGERDIDADTVAKFKLYSWPGNARELRNCLYRAAAMSDHRVLRAWDFDIELSIEALARQPFRIERLVGSNLEDLLRRNKGNVSAAARELGVPRTSLRDRLKRLGFPDLSYSSGAS